MAMSRVHLRISHGRRALAWSGLAALLALGLAACSTFPNTGPSAESVRRDAGDQGGRHYALVEVNYGVIQAIADHPAHPLASIALVSSNTPDDLIGEGDTLAIGIYQAGAGPMVLGGDNSPQSSPFPTAASSSSASAETQVMPRIVVGRDGLVTVPYAGQVRVVGLTPAEAAAAIKRALAGRAINPQVIVSVLSSFANSVTVIGQVKSSSRYAIGVNDDRLLDVIAAAGGVTADPADLVVTVTRGSQSASIPMALLMSDASQNVRLAPGDQVRVTPQIRKIEAFGALGRVSEIPMQDETVTMASALGRAGGLNSFTANPNSVLLFRFERPEVAKALGVQLAGWKPDALVPIVYRLNLRDPQGYFLATKFQMQPDDLIDVPEADLAQVEKFFTMISAASSSFYYYTIIGAEAPKI